MSPFKKTRMGLNLLECKVVLLIISLFHRQEPTAQLGRAIVITKKVLVSSHVNIKKMDGLECFSRMQGCHYISYNSQPHLPGILFSSVPSVKSVYMVVISFKRSIDDGDLRRFCMEKEENSITANEWFLFSAPAQCIVVGDHLLLFG